jgi:type IV pilus assembly protein PilB
MLDFDEDKQNKQLSDLKRKEEEDLVAMLAETKYGLPYVDLYKLGIDNEALRAIKEDEARNLKIAPFKLVGKNLYVALRSPTEELKNLIIEDLARKSIIPVFYMTSMASIEKVWERYKELSMAEGSRIGGLDISEEIVIQTKKEITKMQDIKDVIQKELESGKNHKITRLLEIILAGAIAIKASDIHIEPEESSTRLRLRLDGVLQDIDHFSNEIYHLLNSRIKLLSGMKITQIGAQDGRFSITEEDSEISIRTSLIPGAHGETIVMRILDPKAIQIKIEDMGMEKNLYETILEEITKPNGLILLTGPTGSGKTTTLYAFLRKIYSTEINIITIEDPIEYTLDGVTQTQTKEEKNYGFLEGLRAALRQDPDVIMVGEIRDSETAKIAVQSALTGHLVFSTLHTNNAAGVIPRLADLEVNPKIMASALSLSIAQRLVRKLCNTCKTEEVITDKEKNTILSIITSIKEEGKDLSKHNLQENMEIKLYKAVGCDDCNMTGYKGRIGIFEAIKTDENIEKIMPNNPSEREIKKIAKTQGLLSMRQDGVVKMLNGITSYEEVISVVDLNEE